MEAVLFAQIAEAIYDKGYFVADQTLPLALTETLYQQALSIQAYQFHRAGVGRDENHLLSEAVRTDEVCWVTGESPAGQAWLQWVAGLQDYLNSRLFLGLFSFESHFAHFAPGDYYKRHVDAFKGEANRVLSLIVYLNPDWNVEDGGELVIYAGEAEGAMFRISPNFGKLVVFLSEEFPHEVLPASRDRYSIAGWFRLNSSTAVRVDPPT